MAAVAAKPLGAATKMKKPPAPLLQTNMNGVKPTAPSSSPSSARKTLPGQNQTPTSATSNSTGVNGTARPNRRLQRLNTRNNTTETSTPDKRASKKFPEPYVPKASHILRKFKGSPPSLIVHLHPTHFRFDQQDGSFSYHSEMRVFIEHLAKGTIPHDMVEEFRKSEVKYYDGWLIVRVVDHKSVAKEAAASGTAADDEKPFSIHNYNQYITPSPYVPYPAKEQSVARSPPTKQEHRESISGDMRDPLHSDDTIDVAPKPTKPQPKIYHVALRPTILSKHMDLVIDAMAPDPKSLNRKQSQANGPGRPPGSTAPQTPLAGVPPTPSAEKGPPLKKQKLKIDPKDFLEYEARVVNATAPPLYLDPVDSMAEAEALIDMLRDPQHDEPPPSPKSRKRTVAELAAEDAHAKGQERFMLIMDERTSGGNGATNAGAVDGQAASALFQPRFEKFNALDNIKRDIAERKQREKDRQLQEDENRRGQQERLQEEEKRRMVQRAQEARVLRARQQEMQAAMAAQQQQQAQAAQRPPAQHVNGIPPNMQNQMMSAQQRGSPIIRQGTPQHAASSPVVSAVVQGGHPMAMTSSQQGHGSPPRPGSALQHAHPSAPMVRINSGQAPSRNGTPQLGHGTPAASNATPIMRQGTPAQHITQASPHSNMTAPTPQMMPSGMMQGMPGQMPNGVQRQPNPQQLAEMQRRHAMQQQAAAQQAAMQQQMMNGMNGTPQMAQAQMAHMQAQHHAQMDRQAALQRQAQQQAAMQQQQGTPGSQHMSPNPSSQSQKAYNQSVAEQMKAQMQSLQQSQTQGSPAPNQMTPQQQAAQLAHAQQQQRMMGAQAQAQNQMMGGVPHPQQRPQMNPQLQQVYQNTLNAYTQRFLSQAAAKYGGNTNMLQPNEMQQVQTQAKTAAMNAVRKRQAEMNQLQVQQAQMRQSAQAQHGQQGNPMMMNGGGGMMGMSMPMNGNGNVNPNMAQVLQQQQAQQMQQMQMQHAQQMMAQQQQQQNMQFQQR
ncbi:transcription factor SPT20 [Exophiala viscosa]|uniref:Transcription factor SPT20 n=1 Tax=Exophiala viscosa TaxID=2486360 RepID=A0AAN6IAR5_9EURO|nr:transcription factor SPT20 [Exophiala viscosa]